MYLTYPGESVVIHNDIAYNKVISVTSVIDDATGETPLKYFDRTFSYSSDSGGTWSSWINYTANNLDSINTSNFSDTTKFRFKFEIAGNNTNTVMSVSNVSITLTQGTPDCIECCSDNMVTCYRIDGCKEGSFDPYDLPNEKAFYMEMNDSIANTFGIPVRYWKLIPQHRSGDVIFKEWTLTNVSEPVDIKVVVDRNEFPDAKINYNLWGSEYEDNFEVNIMITDWESLFGKGSSPQVGDFMYMLMNNRMYEIRSSYIFRGFMQMQIWFKCALRKYQPKLSNIINSDDIEEDLKKYITTTDDMFSVEVKSEEDRLVKEIQHHTYTEQTDITRIGLDSGVEIINSKLMNDFTLVSEHYYDLSKSRDPAVVYSSTIDLSSERSFMCWFNPKIYSEKNHMVSNWVPDGQNLRVYKSAHNILKGDFVKVLNYSNETIIVSVLDSTTDYFLIEYSHPILNYTRVYLDKIFGGSKTSLNIDMLDGKLIVYFIGVRYDFDIPILKDHWYVMNLNLSNVYKQMTLNLWERSLEATNDYSKYNNGTTKLNMVYEKINTISNFNVQLVDHWHLSKTHIKITNIRLFKSISDRDKQQILLNQNIVQDSHNIILADNAVPRINITKISKNL